MTKIKSNSIYYNIHVHIFVNYNKKNEDDDNNNNDGDTFQPVSPCVVWFHLLAWIHCHTLEKPSASGPSCGASSHLLARQSVPFHVFA
jgi:hypothetical protein